MSEREAIDAMLTARDPWAAMDDLVDRWSDAIGAACEACWVSADAREKKHLVELLARAARPETDRMLAAWLRSAPPDVATRVLATLSHRGVVVSTDRIVQALDDASPAAIAASAVSRDPSLVPRLVALLDTSLGSVAALALAAMGRTELAPRIVELAQRASEHDAARYLLALERLGDRSVLPALVRWMGEPNSPTWELHHAMFALTGREPLVEITKTSWEERDRATRRAWAAFDVDALASPRLGSVVIESGARGRFELHDGRARVCIDYDATPLDSQWPRWDKSLRVDGRPIYGIGSDCGTCEALLTRAGAPPESALSEAAEIRSALADVEALTPGLLDALRPLVFTLRTGHYEVRLVDLAIERTDESHASWLTRRYALRKDDDEASRVWRGPEHFQVAARGRGTLPTFGILPPLEDLARLSEETIARHDRAIGDGRAPTAVLLGWVVSREIRGEFPERVLMLPVLDGHHKLAAYTRRGTPARCLVIARLEDSWGSPDEALEDLRS